MILFGTETLHAVFEILFGSQRFPLHREIISDTINVVYILLLKLFIRGHVLVIHDEIFSNFLAILILGKSVWGEVVPGAVAAPPVDGFK